VAFLNQKIETLKTCEKARKQRSKQESELYKQTKNKEQKKILPLTCLQDANVVIFVLSLFKNDLHDMTFPSSLSQP
jgi:hypothetical protein